MEYLVVNGRKFGDVVHSAEVNRHDLRSNGDATVGHRRHLRTRAEHLMVRIRVGNGAIIADVADISLGGFFASSGELIPLGAFVELSLIRPGAAEVRVNGVIVDDAVRRKGLAVRFEGVAGEAARQVQRVVEEQQDRVEGRDPDRGVGRTLRICPPSQVANRDDELAALRAAVSELQNLNAHLASEAADGARAAQLACRLQLQVEWLTDRLSGVGGVDIETLANIRRDAELAWTASARVSDAVAKLR
jgi:hypothetical protein